MTDLKIGILMLFVEAQRKGGRRRERVENGFSEGTPWVSRRERIFQYYFQRCDGVKGIPVKLSEGSEMVPTWALAAGYKSS